MLPPRAVWFITGCSTGIGAAIAAYVLSQNHIVIATARDPSTLTYLPDSSPSILKLALDVTDPQSIDKALATALSHFERIDVLVNNAGLNTLGIAETLPDELLRRAMETNFWGPVRLTRKAVGIFRDVNPKSGTIGGTVVNVTSIGGRIALPAASGYHASKFALEGFTESIAGEMDPAWRIRMLILEPGGTKSQFVATSTLTQGPRHPAYADPESAVNKMIQTMMDPKLADQFADASELASCLFETLQKEEIPLRLPTGADAYAIVKAKEKAKMDELEKWRAVSESVGDIHARIAT